MKKFLLLALVILMIGSVIPVHAIYTSIGSGAIVVHTTVEKDKPTVIERKIYNIRNSNEYVVAINISAIDDIANITEILDNNFLLGPGEQQDARFIVTLDQPGTYTGKLAVKFTPIGDNLTTRSGAILAAKISIFADGEGVNNTDNNIDDNKPDDNIPPINNENNPPTDTKPHIVVNQDEPIKKPSMLTMIIIITAIIIAALAIFLIFALKYF